MDGPIDQFDKPTYIPTNEPLREAYFRTIAADVLVEDSENVEKRSGKWVLRERNPAIPIASALVVRTLGRKFAVSSTGFLALVCYSSLRELGLTRLERAAGFILRGGGTEGNSINYLYSKSE
jgi:hypothetical protein